MFKIAQPLKDPVVTQEFGENPDIYGKFGLPGHNGRDYGCKIGTLILACADGVVVKSEKHPSYGNIVKLKHQDGYFSLYAHLNESKVILNQAVKQGDVIALSGNTGFTSGPHLHFGIQAKDGKKEYLYYIDPRNVM